MTTREFRQRLSDHPYFSAIAISTLFLTGQILLRDSVLKQTPFLLLFFGITFSAWLGGMRAGLLATAIITAAADKLLIEPYGLFGDNDSTGWFTLIVFAIEGALISVLLETLKRENSQLSFALETSEASRERAENANRVKCDFIANMSHGIRAPLTAVLGYSDLLLDESISGEDRRQYSERIKLNASALTHLASELLDVTAIDSSDFVANRKRIVLADFIQRVYTKFAPVAEEKGLKFQVQLRGSLPAIIESDPEQLEQVIRHVVDNAIFHTKDGLIKLTATASKTNSRRELALIVTDQGPGISPHVKAKLFKPFGRETSTSRPRTHGGTGLGLTLARKLSRSLGGDVRLVKTNSHGSTFLITIDAGRVDGAHEFIDELCITAPAKEIAPDNPRALEGLKVLIVDDSADSALLVGRMLKIVGAQVETADRGQAGIEKALKNQPDIVLMDIEMPEMDGNEATRRLRAQGFKKPIIALSAHVMKEDQQEAERAGSSEFLMKPVSRKRLFEMVGRFARLSSMRYAHA